VKPNERYPDEDFLADAFKAGKASRQEVSMKAIGTPDARLQARINHLDMNHVHMLSGILESEGRLGPVVIFEDEETGAIHLADGFHRHEVYRKAKKTSIPAVVVKIPGAWEEAVSFAAMCNRRLCLSRTKEDIRKAVRMLLETPTWFDRSDKWIAAHCGSSSSTVQSERHSYCEEKGTPLPGKVLSRQDRAVAYQRRPPLSRTESDLSINSNGHGFLGTTILGKTIYRRGEKELRDAATSVISDLKRYEYGLVQTRLLRKYPHRTAGKGHGRLPAFCCRGIVFVVASGSESDPFGFSAIGKAVLARIAFPGQERTVVVRHPSSIHPRSEEMASEAGIEFMTIEGLFADLDSAKEETA
jgi:hypothetical protein